MSSAAIRQCDRLFTNFAAIFLSDPYPRPLDHFRRERYDLHELPCPQFTRDQSENARADRLVVAIDQDSGIPVEPNAGSVLTADLFGRTDNHRAMDITLFHTAPRDRFLDADHDDIADTEQSFASNRQAP